MAKKSVLKAFVANKSQVSVCFIQKVTDKIICVIRDEKGTEYHHLTDGTLRTSDKTKKSFVVDSEAVQKFLFDSHLKVWDGGWKPDYNSRGEQKSKKLGSLSAELSAGGTYETWLTKAGFNIEMLPMSESIASLLKGEVAEPKQETLPFDESQEEFQVESSQESSQETTDSPEPQTKEVDDTQSPQDHAESSEVEESEAPAEETKPKKAKATKSKATKSKATKSKATKSKISKTKATKSSSESKKAELEVEDEAPAEEFDDQEVGDDEFDF